MNETAAVLLMLLCMLAASGWVWSVIVTRRAARGKNRFIAHLIGALSGIGAAFGAFCLSGALLMPGTADRAPIVIGALGALILCTYLGVLHHPKKKAPHSAKAVPAALTAAAAEDAIDETPVPPRMPRKRFKESIQTWWQEEKRRQDESRRQQEQKHIEREKALGMPLGTFFSERADGHFMLWCVALFLVVWGSLFVCTFSAEDWLISLLMSFIVTCVLAAAYGVLCLLIVPTLLLFLALLPFIGISILAEAWWRIRRNRPYIIASPPVAISYYDDIAPSATRQDTCDWFVPLAIGLWIGSSWHKNH